MGATCCSAELDMATIKREKDSTTNEGEEEKGRILELVTRVGRFSKSAISLRLVLNIVWQLYSV
jgi:hypothetical protein